METVAFYSYKGGDGRSTLLATAARFQAARGKGVVALDFDFEAPGLHYKLGGPGRLLHPYKPTPQALAKDHPFALFFGAVPYLIATAEGTAFPPSLDEHLTSVPVPDPGWLALMPAGPAPDPIYWTALKELSDKLRLGDPSGRGLMALLDLQARIADKLTPDYLLIDTRSGLTELGGLATTVLADTVVCMCAANQESIDGTRAVMEALKKAPRLASQRPLRIVPVLSRTRRSHDRFEFASGIGVLKELGEGEKVFVVPHDETLPESPERVGNVAWSPTSDPALQQAYLNLFQSLFQA